MEVFFQPSENSLDEKSTKREIREPKDLKNDYILSMKKTKPVLLKEIDKTHKLVFY